VFQFELISSNFAQPLKRSGTTFHRPQSSAWSTLCWRDVPCCMRQMVVTSHTDWFCDSCPYFFKGIWPTDAYLYSQSCEIHKLGPNLFISIDFNIFLYIFAFIFLFRVYIYFLP
jgi:hypothetical protein